MRHSYLSAFILLAGLTGGIPSCLESVSSLLFARDLDSLPQVDSFVERAVADGRIPGAVVLVSHRGETVFLKA